VRGDERREADHHPEDRDHVPHGARGPASFGSSDGSVSGDALGAGASRFLGATPALPVLAPTSSTSPSGPTTAPGEERPTASDRGARTSAPFASRHDPCAMKSVPSALRTEVHGANAAFAGGTTHRPFCHPHLRPRHIHSPSIQTASGRGALGTTSTRAGGGGYGTSKSALAGCCTIRGRRTVEPPHAAIAIAAAARTGGARSATIAHDEQDDEESARSLMRDAPLATSVRRARSESESFCHEAYPAGSRAAKNQASARGFRPGPIVAKAPSAPLVMHPPRPRPPAAIVLVARRVLVARAATLALLAWSAAGTGCASIPNGRQAVNSVDLRGAKQVDASDVTDKLATEESPKFLMLFRGVVYDYSLFDRFVLQRDLARVERFYRARGYYDAHARAGRVYEVDSKHVRVEIVVDEGPPVLVSTVSFPGTEGLPPPIVDAVRRSAAAALRPEEPFDEESFEKTEDQVRRALTDRGYAYAKVRRDAAVDVVHHTADVSFTVAPGEPATFGDVTIEGLGELPEDVVRRSIAIRKGAAYSTAEIDAAQQALLDLEVFSSVDIRPDLPEPPPEDRVVPLHVKVEPARLRSITLGGGFEFDLSKTDVHALGGWESHNFFGGLRDFTVDLRPGVVLYPLRIDNIKAPNRLLPEEKLRVQLRQPGVLEARTNGFVRPELNVNPFLPPRLDESAPVLGYVEARASVGVDRSFFRHLFATVQYNFQVESPFTYKGELDPALQRVVISSPQLITNLDFRNDKIHPRSGFYLGNDLQLAGYVLGGTADDVRVQPEVRGYVPLGRRVTFAARGIVGFLLPSNYGGQVKDGNINVPLSEANRAERTRDFQTMYFRGFFSGGPSSNRGFPFRGIGPHAVVPFLNPAAFGRQLATGCSPGDPRFDPTRCAVTVGGFTLWEQSTEVRFTVSGPFTAAVFCDMSDVSPEPGRFRFDHPHLSCGAGARYDTPVGPIRLDVGYRVQPLQVLGQPNETAAYNADHSEGLQPTILGVPLAIAFGIGESF